ncbi:MAG TPA: hypothetical protein VK714_08445 [Myxococcota bacterium]|nr:hypothetical protein [Myxococcota bacterium]
MSLPNRNGSAPAFALQDLSFAVGYDDIHPMNVRARDLAIGEAVVGQLYGTIKIARLEALERVQRA